jgi:hypothetical protein
MKTMTYRQVLGLSIGLLGLWLVVHGQAAAAPPGDSTPTTESTCTFGMTKGQAKQSCQVPIPPGCLVARVPDTTKPWANISKGGNTSCRFSEKDTDWKTKIIGTCDRCKSGQCSARFAVVFDCSGTGAPYQPQSR